MTGDRVTLTVPAKGEYARAVRMTAAALASRTGMTYDEVEDVRMAAEEAFVYAVDSLAEGDEVTVVFEVCGDSMAIRVCLGPVQSDAEGEADRAALATFILDSVCDRYEFTSDEAGVRTLVVEKCAGIADAV